MIDKAINAKLRPSAISMFSLSIACDSVGVFIQAVFIPRILFMGILVKKKKLLTMLVVNNAMKVKVEQSVIGNHMIPRAIWNK